MEKGVIKLYFTFENCIIKYLFVFYRTRSSSNSTLSSKPAGAAASKREETFWNCSDCMCRFMEWISNH